MSDAPEPEDTAGERTGPEGEEVAENVPVTQEETLEAQLEIGEEELSRPPRGLALSGLSAGLDIGFGPLLRAILVMVAGTVWSTPTLRIATGVAYAIGFVFVVLSGTELFTEHTTLAVVPVLDGDASVADLGRLWGIVYGTNLVGGAVFATGMVSFGPKYGLLDAAALYHLAEPLVSHSATATVTAAILAGWLMALLSWMVTSVTGSGARIALVVLVTSVIGIGHLPHSIAGSVEVFAAMLASSAVSPLDYLRFLLLSTTGNVVGGTLFVSLLKYGYISRGS